jgi:hypothetical protein
MQAFVLGPAGPAIGFHSFDMVPAKDSFLHSTADCECFGRREYVHLYSPYLRIMRSLSLLHSPRLQEEGDVFCFQESKSQT